MAAADMPVVGAPSAGGDLGSAPAPGPGMGMPPADVLFTLTAAGANLSAEKLVLTGVADTALFSSSSRQTGVYTTGRHLDLFGFGCTTLLASLPLGYLWLESKYFHSAGLLSFRLHVQLARMLLPRYMVFVC